MPTTMDQVYFVNMLAVPAMVLFLAGVAMALVRGKKTVSPREDDRRTNGWQSYPGYSTEPAHQTCQ